MVGAVGITVLLVFRTPRADFPAEGGLFWAFWRGVPENRANRHFPVKIVDFPKSSDFSAFFLVPAAPVGLALFAVS